MSEPISEPSMCRILLFVVALSMPLISHAYLDARHGDPLVQSFTPEEYNGDGQCFDIAVMSDNRIYVANSSGLLEFDGQHWSTIPGTEGSIFLSIAVDSLDRLWVGSVTEPGVVIPDAAGNMTYHSLAGVLSDSMHNLQNVWRIHVLHDGIYFQSPRLLARYRLETLSPLEGEVTYWPGEGHYYTMVASPGESILVKRNRKQLEELRGDSLVVYEPTRDLPPKTVVHAIAFNDTAILATDYVHGFFLLHDTGWTSLDWEVNDLIDGTLVFGCRRLDKERFVLSGAEHGLVVFDRTGRILERIDEEDGLPSSMVNRVVRFDQSGGVWAALDYGLARIQLRSPLRVLGASHGMVGSVLDIHRRDNTYYIASSAGLYRMQFPTTPGQTSHFELVSNHSQSCWSLNPVGPYLVVGAVDGLYTVDRRGEVSRVGDFNGNTSAVVVSPNGQLVYTMAELRGLQLYHFNGSSIRHEGTVTRDLAGVLSLHISAGALWFLNTQNGEVALSRAALDYDNPLNLQFETLGETHGLTSGITGDLFQWNNQLLLILEEGLVQYDETQDRFISADPALDRILHGEFTELSAETTDPQGRLYASAGPYNLIRLEQLKDGYRVERPIAPVRMRRSYTVFYDTLLDAAVIGGDDGRIAIYNAPGDTTDDAPPELLIRAVTLQEDSLLAAWVSGASEPMLTLSWPVTEIRFSFSLLAYDAPSENQYQYFLSGIMDSWSDWSTESYHDFNNLPEGEYTFMVRGRDVYGHVSDPLSCSFFVLPPWYRTTLAWISWVVLAVLLIYIVFRLRLNQLEKQKYRLEEQVKERTAELREAQQAELREIEARKSAEIEAQRLSTATQLATTISHEFNNPLAVILGRLDLAETCLNQPETLGNYHKSIRNQVHRMSDLVQKLKQLEEIREVDYAIGVKMLDLHGTPGEDESLPEESGR